MSSEFTSRNITYTGNLERPGATLGEILVNDGSDVFQLFAPGPDGNALTSDSGEPLGVRWGPVQLIWETFLGNIARIIDQDTVTNFVLCNSTNSISSDCDNTSVVSSSGSSVTNTGGTIPPTACSVIASVNSTIQDIEAPVSTSLQASAIAACSTCTITGDRSDTVFIAGSTVCDVLTTMANGNTGPRAILGSFNCDLSYNGCSFLSSQNLTIGSTAGEVDEFTSYISCFGLTHARSGDFNTFLSTTTTTTTGAHTRCFVKATNASIAHSGVTVMTDDNGGGATLTTTAANSWLSRFSNGEVHNTNAALTTGVTLAAGASTWGMVSNKYVKENFNIVDSDDILERVRNLPIYEYNFIGNPKEIKCIGPVAQDWHSIVTPLDPIIEVVQDPEDKEKTVKVEKDAKNKLAIETMDMIGVCLASIKSLDKKIETLFEESKSNDQRIQDLEEGLEKMLREEL